MLDCYVRTYVRDLAGPGGARTRSLRTAMAVNVMVQKILQRSQLRWQGEFRYISVRGRQRSRPCGQNLRGPFVRSELATKVEESARAMAADGPARQKRLYLHHQGEFHHNYCAVLSLHDSDHDGVVGISVDLSCVL